MRLIRKPAKSKARTDFLSEEECKKLLKSCKESRNSYLYAIVAIGICTGMRKNEILGLRWKDVDFNKQLIHLKDTKNGLSRDVPLIPFITQILKNMFENEQTPDLSYEIFPRLNIRYLDIRSAWNFALKRAGLTRKGIVFHTLRHTCRSLLDQAGASLRESMDILGHLDVQSSNRYAHTTQERLKQILELTFKKVSQIC